MNNGTRHRTKAKQSKNKTKQKTKQNKAKTKQKQKQNQKRKQSIIGLYLMKFDDTKGIIKSHSLKDRKYNG
jgi:FtsZ-interacting cell division protein YlmF